MKIFDCFLFFNELELLELRLMTLSNVVDYFVLVEADTSFTGNAKSFIFENNKQLYKKYLDKIIYIKVDDTPVLDRTKDVWAIESFQRNCITRGLVNAKPEDRVIVSDVDEIPDPTKLMQVKDSNNPVTFNQYLFYYFVNCFGNRTWNGSIIIPYMKMDTPSKTRELARRGFNKIKNGGWHYSYMGGIDRVKLKFKSLSDAYTRIDLVGSDEDIMRKINSQKDLWDENRSHSLIDISKEGYAPESIKQFIEKHPTFYFDKA
ncbi:MAG: hypothetical protein ABIO02_00460 [Patescibacteria group bacterium]